MGRKRLGWRIALVVVFGVFSVFLILGSILTTVIDGFNDDNLGPFVAGLIFSILLAFCIGSLKKAAKLNKAALQEASAAAGFDIPAGHESFATQKCPQCDSADWMPLGTPGYITRSLWAVFFGFIGALAANSSGKNRAETPAFICKCRSCRNKWEARPKEVPLEARLETPCRISMTRPGSFVGAAVAQFIYLNGKRVGILKNGGTIEFETAEPYNILFATDGSGTAFQNTRYFEAPSGGELNFNFNRKFV